MNELFEKASRLKLRFNYRGASSAEDLWDISLTDLDGMFKELNTEFNNQKGESLLQVGNPTANNLELRINLIKHVVKVRLQENTDREDVLAKKAQKQRILEIIASKQDEVLLGKSTEELTKLVAEM